MPIDIPQAQLNYFDEHHYLELEDYFTETQIASLHAIIESHIDATSFESAYKTGHDLWRTDNAIKKVTLSRDLADIFSQLTKTKPLRIGFDQVLFSIPPTQKPTLLKDMCSVGPPAGGLLINLSKSAIDSEDIAPHTPGSLLFFKNTIPLPLPTLNPGLFFLIAYCSVKPLYISCKADPHSRQLMDMGYAIGDHLTPETHPVLIK